MLYSCSKGKKYSNLQYIIQNAYHFVFKIGIDIQLYVHLILNLDIGNASFLNTSETIIDESHVRIS